MRLTKTWRDPLRPKDANWDPHKPLNPQRSAKTCQEMIRPTEIHQGLLQATETKTRQDLPRFTETTLDAPRSVWTPRDPPRPAAILQDPMRSVKTCRNLLKHTATHWDLVKPPQYLPRPSMTRFSSGFWWSMSASMYLSKFFLLFCRSRLISMTLALTECYQTVEKVYKW